MLLLASGVTALVSGLPAQEQPAYTFGTTVVSSSGLQGRIYHLRKNTPRLPRFERMRPVGLIYTKSLSVWPRSFHEGFPGLTKRFEWFAIDYTGRFWIERSGVYRFSLLSDDGAKLSIDGQTVIDSDGLHPPESASASAVLTRGVHDLRVCYFQGPRFSVALVLALARDGQAWRIFNTDDFKPPSDSVEWQHGEITRIKPEKNGFLELAWR
jgi:hypothetical protein